MMAQYLPDFNLFHLLVVCVALSFGGFVKGVSAFGLPTISVPIIFSFMSLPAAVAVLVIPMITTNLLQMVMSGHIRLTFARHWRLFVPLYLTLPIGVYLLSAVDTKYLLIVVGIVLMTVAILEFSGVSFAFLGRRERIFGPLIGLVAGVIGGITTLFGILPIFFFVALGLDKEKFVAAVSVLLFTGSIALMLSLQSMSFLRLTELSYSLIGLGPLFAGMWAGTKVRHRIDQTTFKNVVLALITVMGASMIFRAFA